MEITELVEYYYNPKSKTISVTFRLEDDDDDHVRVDEFEIKHIEKSGYYIVENYESDDLNFVFDDDFNEVRDEEIFEEEFEYEIEENELLSYMSEFYTKNPKKLPNSIIF